MAKSFLSTASKKVTNVRSFLREAAGGASIKYSAEKGAKHIMYIPYVNMTQVDENGKEEVIKQVIAISGDVHEWHDLDGSYKATVCMKDVFRQADDSDLLLNDGSCPICDRTKAAWEIYNYRVELEKAKCTLTGEDRKKHLDAVTSSFSDERKAKNARGYMYMLAVKYRTEGGKEVLGEDKLPEYDLKVMKLSTSRIDKLQQQLANSGSDLPGAELMFEYPATDNRMLQVSQSTTAPVFPNNMFITRYPGLLDKITSDVNKFEWEGIDKSFPEWEGMSTAKAKEITDELFANWDSYKKNVLINPSAKYMEYLTSIPESNPQINSASVPSAAPAAALPGAAPVVLDANDVFGGATAPTITL